MNLTTSQVDTERRWIVGATEEGCSASGMMMLCDGLRASTSEEDVVHDDSKEKDETGSNAECKYTEMSDPEVKDDQTCLQGVFRCVMSCLFNDY